MALLKVLSPSISAQFCRQVSLTYFHTYVLNILQPELPVWPPLTLPSYSFSPSSPQSNVRLCGLSSTPGHTFPVSSKKISCKTRSWSSYKISLQSLQEQMQLATDALCPGTKYLDCLFSRRSWATLFAPQQCTSIFNTLPLMCRSQSSTQLTGLASLFSILAAWQKAMLPIICWEVLLAQPRMQ